jgi:hypothetical protein
VIPDKEKLVYAERKVLILNKKEKLLQRMEEISDCHTLFHAERMEVILNKTKLDFAERKDVIFNKE